MTDEPQDVHDGIVIGSDDSDIAGDFKMPSQEELLKVIENMPGLNEETKQELREGILRRGQLGEAAAQFLPPAKIAEENVKNTSLEVIMLLSLISFVFLVLVFFGYKLYKSLVERERRREEKKRQKLQKKKK